MSRSKAYQEEEVGLVDMFRYGRIRAKKARQRKMGCFEHLPVWEDVRKASRRRRLYNVVHANGVAHDTRRIGGF